MSIIHPLFQQFSHGFLEKRMVFDETPTPKTDEKEEWSFKNMLGGLNPNNKGNPKDIKKESAKSESPKPKATWKPSDIFHNPNQKTAETAPIKAETAAALCKLRENVDPKIGEKEFLEKLDTRVKRIQQIGTINGCSPVDPDKIGINEKISITFPNQGLEGRITAGQTLPEHIQKITVNSPDHQPETLTGERRGLTGEFFAKNGQRLKIYTGTTIEVDAVRDGKALEEIRNQNEKTLSEYKRDNGTRTELAKVAIANGVDPVLAESFIDPNAEKDPAGLLMLLTELARQEDDFRDTYQGEARTADGKPNPKFIAFVFGGKGEERVEEVGKRFKYTDAQMTEAKDLFRERSTYEVPSDGTALTDLKNLIASGESGTKGYNAYNRGKAGGDLPPRNLVIMPISAIMELQEKGELFAVGRFQWIPETLKKAVAWCGIDKSQPFSPENQEKLFLYCISVEKRPHLNKYLTGKSEDLDAALDDIALEWRALKNSKGVGASDGDSAGNHASIDNKDVANLLQRVRVEYLQGRPQVSSQGSDTRPDFQNSATSSDYERTVLGMKRGPNVTQEKIVTLATPTKRMIAALAKEFPTAVLMSAVRPEDSNTRVYNGKETDSDHQYGLGFDIIGCNLRVAELFLWRKFGPHLFTLIHNPGPHLHVSFRPNGEKMGEKKTGAYNIPKYPNERSLSSTHIDRHLGQFVNMFS